MVTSIFYFFYYLVATLTMESVKTAEVMLRGNVSGNYIAMNTKGELYSTVSQTGDCLKFYVLQYSISYTKRTPNQGHVSFFQTIKPQPSWGTVTIRSSCTFTSQEYARFLVKVATESLILIKRETMGHRWDPLNPAKIYSQKVAISRHSKWLRPRQTIKR